MDNIPVPWIRPKPKTTKLLTFHLDNKPYHIMLCKDYYWFMSREWLPELKYKNYQETVKKLYKEYKKVFSLPVEKGQQPLHSAIRHDIFFIMVDRVKKENAQPFKQWILNKVLPELNLPNKGKKIPREVIKVIEKEPVIHPEIKKQLTLYFVEREEWLTDIEATPSEDAPNWLPGTTIKTTNKDDRNKVLEVIKMGYLPPEQFVYIEYYPIIPIQHIYSYKADGSLNKFTQVNERISKKATK